MPAARVAVRAGVVWLLAGKGPTKAMEVATEWARQQAPGRVRARFKGNWRGIGPRLLAGFLLVIIPAVVIGAVAMQRFSALSARTMELSTRDLPEVESISHMRTLLFKQRDLLTESPAAIAAGEPSVLASLVQVRAVLLALEPPNSPQTQATDMVLVHTLTTGITRFEALAPHGRVLPGAVAALRGETPQLDAMLAATKQLRQFEESEAVAAALQVHAESSASTRLVLALTLLSVSLSVVVALWLTRSLTRPLSWLLRATAQLAGGNLQAGPRIHTADEIGQLATAFETMRINLRETIAALDRERRQSQAIVEASADGVMLVDAQHRIVQINPAALRVTGRAVPEVEGQHWWSVCGLDADLATASAWSDTHDLDSASPLLGAGGVHRDVLVHLVNGEQRWCAISCVPVPPSDEAREARMVVNLHDISQLKAIDQLKSDFVAMVSHELRAPLTTVGGAVEMLGMLDASVDRDAYQEVAGILRQQTGRLRAVVEEVLLVTRLEAGRLPVRLQPLVLPTFVQQLVARVHEDWTGDDRPILLTIPDEDLRVWADPRMLEIVLRNLFDNARKYTAVGSALELEIRPEAAGTYVQLRLGDHGPGIPAGQRERIFERFARGDHASWTRGYGLGLYIARELMRAHNGAMWVEDRQPHGACFVCQFCTEVDPHLELEATG
jgi:PAS domain S-box-containing protein